MSLPRVRKGSALLVVLGMLSFLIVSAVAFSAYMRSARAPSSFLRRVVSSRLLAQAALAEAIDEVDAAIGNFPHPGVWNSASFSDSANKNTKNGSRVRGVAANSQANVNAWLGRVFVGTNGLNGINQTTVQKELTNQVDTVPTLTLEGLAYIPPPLVDEARYFSRRSAAGKWHTMKFDAGRYAFCAIDVSDYFDINSLHAGWPRSSDPGSRISLAHLFENDAHDKVPEADLASSWDRFISTYTTVVPLVSIADFNLALNQSGTWITSPFIDYLSTSGGKFYSKDEEKLRRATFVTDGWFPPEQTATSSSSSSLSSEMDLALGQPFDINELKTTRFYDALFEAAINPKFDPLMKRFPELARAALWDYLDYDSVPTSLAIPTTERVPMYCGLRFESGKDVSIETKLNDPVNEVSNEQSEENKQTRHVSRTVRYCLNVDGLVDSSLEALAVYPFRHGTTTAQFTPDARIAVFFTAPKEGSTDGVLGLRPKSAVDGLKFYNNKTFDNSLRLNDGSVFLAQYKSPSAKVPSGKVTDEDSAFTTIKFGEPTALADLADDKNPFLTLVYETDQTRTKGDNGWSEWVPKFPENDDKSMPDPSLLTSAHCSMPPLQALGPDDGQSGKVDETISKDESLLKLLQGGKSRTLDLKVAVWARFLDSANKTVDLVPACQSDDNINGPVKGAFILEQAGKETPLLKFDTGVQFTLSLADIGNAKGTVATTTIMVEDPRYNYAPENWYIVSGGNLDKEEVKNAAYGVPKSTDYETPCRDGDIFMSVSDQGYLQSVYELANLPRLRHLGFVKDGNSADVCGDLTPPQNWKNRPENGNYVTDKTKTLHHDVMWRTYDPFLRYFEHYDNDGVTFEDLHVVNSGVGFKINPYTDSESVMMAAFANTPHDWRCASTNEETNADIVNKTAVQFNQEYAWNEYSSGCKLAWDDLKYVADKFMEGMRKADSKGAQDGSANDRSWEDVWGNLPWYGEDKSGKEVSDYLLERTLNSKSDALYNTDKKFLYGYWHDCFAVKQQLFLIFVRAEPMLMGGGDARQAPPQLGVRAVALVWRDPMDRTAESGAKSTGTYPHPHRTRVLFYHQFD